MQPSRCWLKLDRFAQKSLGLVVSAIGNQDAGQLQIASHASRLEWQRLSHYVLRLRQPTLRSEQKAQGELGSGVGRDQFLGLTEFDFGCREIEVGCQQHP